MSLVLIATRSQHDSFFFVNHSYIGTTICLATKRQAVIFTELIREHESAANDFLFSGLHTRKPKLKRRAPKEKEEYIDPDSIPQATPPPSTEPGLGSFPGNYDLIDDEANEEESDEEEITGEEKDNGEDIEEESDGDTEDDQDDIVTAKNFATGKVRVEEFTVIIPASNVEIMEQRRLAGIEKAKSG